MDTVNSPSHQWCVSPFDAQCHGDSPSLSVSRAFSYLAGVGEVVASGGASEGREGAADEASCRGALLLPAAPGPVLSAGVPAEGSARAAAVPFAGGLAIPRISAVPCGSSGAQ